MTAKRPAQYELDEKTLEEKKLDQTPNGQTNKQENSDGVHDRNIIAVKKDTQEDNSKSQKPTESNNKPSGLFSSLFNQPTNGSGLFSSSTGLFTNNSSSLFNNNNATTGGLFSKPASGSTGLFSPGSAASSQPKTGGLFSSNPTSGSSIFNFQNGGVPPVRQGPSLFGNSGAQGNEEDDSGDSAELEAAQNIEADPSKSKTSYNYETTCILILKQKAFKFKKLGNDLIQNVDVVITHDKSTQLYYISIQLPATKKSIYSGVIILGKSQVKHLNNKKENVEISAFNVVKGKREQAVLRCQFEKESQGLEVFETVEKIVKGEFVVKEEEKKEEGEKKEEKKEEKNEEKKEEKKEEQSKKEEKKEQSKKE